MHSMISQDFETLEQRLLYYYIVTMPGFAACDCENISLESQQQLYAFLAAIPITLYANPTLIGLNATPDAWYPDFTLNKTNPDLIKQMRKIIDKMNKVYLNLIKVGQFGTIVDGRLIVAKEDVRFTKKTLAQLESLGLDSHVEGDTTEFWSRRYPAILPAFKALAETVQEQNNKNDMVSAYRRGLLSSGDTNTIAVVFERLLADSDTYARLTRYLTKNGYWQGVGNIHDIRLDWIKNSNKRDLKIRSPEAATHFWGLSVHFDFRRKNQLAIQMRLPKYKEVLLEFDNLSEAMQQIIMTHTKRCDGCRYCVQTDKTGTRSLAAIPVTFSNRTYKLCPLYPVWGYQWTTIDDALVDKIITILDCVDALYTKKAVV